MAPTGGMITLGWPLRHRQVHHGPLLLHLLGAAPTMTCGVMVTMATYHEVNGTVLLPPRRTMLAGGGRPIGATGLSGVTGSGMRLMLKKNPREAQLLRLALPASIDMGSTSTANVPMKSIAFMSGGRDNNVKVDDKKG